jgi:transposase
LTLTALLEELDRRYGPKLSVAIKPTVLTLDNGPILAERAHWMTVEWLPKYAPELNDIEEVWRDLKRHHRAHQTFTGADASTTASITPSPCSTRSACVIRWTASESLLN